MNNNIILLDLGGVVFQSTGNSTSQIDWKIITQLNHKYGFDLNIGLDKFPDFMADYNQLSFQTLTGFLFLKYLHETLQINTELIEIVKDYGDIIIVSDNYKENIEYISKLYDFESWSIAQVYSFNYKMVKSNPQFFRKLLSEFENLKNSKIVLIDDSPSKLKSAGQNGIAGIHFQNNEQTQRELNEMYSDRV